MSAKVQLKLKVGGKRIRQWNYYGIDTHLK